MLRLPPTTISLTITEVKEFERRRRFKNYLAKENAFSQLPVRLKPQTLAQNSHESEHCSPEQTCRLATPKPVKAAESNEDLKLLSCPPRRPPKAREPAESASPSKSTHSQSRASSSSVGLDVVENTSQHITLPPPFSLERRVVSDVQSLPSGHAGTRPEASQERARHEPPATPIRRSSIMSAHSTPSETLQFSGTGQRIFSSAARAVESIVRFPRHDSPSPSPRRSISTEPALQSIRAESGFSADISRFSVYDDSLPSFLQPQTPLNLPEARHRSRLSGFYTVSSYSRINRQAVRRFTASQSRPQGDDGPTDLSASGFQDQYADTENPDDTMLHQEAYRSYPEDFPELVED